MPPVFFNDRRRLKTASVCWNKSLYGTNSGAWSVLSAPTFYRQCRPFSVSAELFATRCTLLNSSVGSAEVLDRCPVLSESCKSDRAAVGKSAFL